MRNKPFIFLLAVFVPLLAFAEGNVLTLEKALSLALKNNISLKRDMLVLNASERASRHSWNSLLPSVTVSAIDDVELPDLKRPANYELENPDLKDEKTGKVFRNNIGLEGKVAVTLSSSYFASKDKAKLDYDAARISYEESISETLSQVKEKYFSLILEKQNLEFLKENLESAESQAKQNEVRYRKGTLSEMENLSSKATYEKLKSEFKAQENTYKSNLLSFLRFLGIELLSETQNAEKYSLSGTLEEFVEKYDSFFNENKKSELVQIINAGNTPAIINLKKQMEVAQKQVSIQRHNAFGPSLNLAYTVNPVFAGSDKGRVKQSAYIGISLPLENYLPFSKGADAIRDAQDKVDELSYSIKEKSQDMNADFSNIVENLVQKEESVSAFKGLVNLSQKNYDAVYYSYSKGMTEHLSLKTAAKEKLEAKLNLQSEFLEMLKLYISLEKISGIQLPLEI